MAASKFVSLLNQPSMSTSPALQPFDQFNQELESNVHPPTWENPRPHGKYDLVVIGAGTAGLVTSIGAAGLGAKVALIERDLMGGDCLNVGCVPSKAIIASARSAAGVLGNPELGIKGPDAEVNFQAVMQRMRRIRASISHHDSAKRFTEAGIDVYLGGGRFTAQNRVDVQGQTLKFHRAVIATGARAAVPPIPGIDKVDVLTNETLFSLTSLPQRLIVVGAGPIGVEMAQTFARLGSKVWLVQRGSRILTNDEPDASKIVEESLQRDGVEILLKAKIEEVLQDSNEKRLIFRQKEKTVQLSADEILIAVGRVPNVGSLGLENANVRFDETRGVEVDDWLRTSNRRIYAAGDICSDHKFTHAADFMARTVIRNALLPGRARSSKLTIPRATYSSPELANVGLTKSAAKNQGIEIDTWRQDFDSVDRPLLEGQTNGFVMIHTKKGTDRIVGGTVVAEHAGDMISEITLAMTQGIGLGKLASVIHPYPSTAEAIRKLGDQYNRTRLTPLVAKIFRGWLKVRKFGP